MNRLHVIIALALPLLLAGCLEVEQYPVWRDGTYNGKPDNLHADAVFHGDRLAWNAAIADRNHLQNEYVRTRDARPPEPRRRP